ncbi:MAG: Serine threonine kinase [Trebouxia sp. A1-2]|nr:MAG: Serine threonine kinase [Trebouxia sp. A1-2]
MTTVATVVAEDEKENAGFLGKGFSKQIGGPSRFVLSNRENLPPAKTVHMSNEMSAVPAYQQAPQTPSLRTSEMPAVPLSASRQISWEVHLQQYLQKCAPLSVDKVSSLTQAVHKKPHLPEPWWSIIQHAESQQAACQSDPKPRDKRQGLALLQLYEWATQQIPRQGNYNNDAFLKLWIGYAKQQWSQNGQDEGRDAFKSLKNQQIADKSALLYLQWADLELKSGNTNKAIKQLKTGIKESAQPVRQLEDMLMRLQPQGTNSGTADGLNDSEANTATLHETTQRLHGQHLSGPTEGTEGSAFTTPAGVRCPQGQSPVTGANDSLHQSMSSRRIGHSSKPLYGHNAGATETLVINPKAGLQSRPVAYAAAANASNMTYHSTSSDMTSRSISSHGSSHSGEETQTIHDKTLSGGPLGGEGTIQINQSLAHQSRPASTLVQQSFASAFKRDRSVGPKRTGKPMTLTLQTSLLLQLQEVEARETIQADNSKKRKADGEARQSPEVATAVAGIAGKRRASPEAQARSQRPCSPQQRPAAVTTSSASHGAAPVLHEAPDQAAGSQPPAAEEADEDEPETMPLLARRVMAGRQSIIPGHQRAANQPVAQHAVAPPGSHSLVLSGNVTQQGLPSDASRSGPQETGSVRTSSHLKPPMRRAPAPPPPLSANAPPTAAHVASKPAAVPVKVAADRTGLQAEASGSNRGSAAAADASSTTHQGTADKSKDVAKANTQGKAAMGPPPAKTSCIDLFSQVMAPSRKIFALKRIKLQGKDSEASKGFVDEITLLQRLRGKQNIIQLVDAEVIQAEGTIYMVLEYGDIDLARLLAKHEQARREGGGADELDENFIRLYWQQMLQAVQTIHEARIVHSDLKPANFLMVEGQLKLIDFGIAKAISSDTTSIARESQVGSMKCIT